MELPADYAERVYAGVLGKIIGVYLGRPFEGWTYERIMAELGPIQYYVHEQRNTPLIVTDDDISGTFTFLRALPDYGSTLALTPAQIGQTWLNYIIEQRTILWWGGFGNSTEHTAFLRLKRGTPAPASGSIALNGKVVAEQIGSQIFIDGWAMVAPGDPELAADLARRAASVSHDGEAIYGAQVLAAMEAQAFTEANVDKLLDCGVRFIPADSTIARLIADVREWHVQDEDWETTRGRIAATYGYDKYGGNCHMVPNHALIMLGLLYGQDDLQKSLMITNTSGWDTDCNSGNLGCLLGIKNGLKGIDAGPDWRGPVADRLFLPTADGGRAITDAVRETYEIVNVGRALQGQPPVAPKGGARFHFELPGSVQSFMAEPGATATIENTVGHSARGARSLAIRYDGLGADSAVRVSTATFVPPDALTMPGYQLLASPTLYPGQTVRAGIAADSGNEGAVRCRLVIQIYGADDQLECVYGPEVELAPGGVAEPTWQIPDTDSAPIATVGLELAAATHRSGSVYLDYLTWDGEPDVVFSRPSRPGKVWRRAWVDAVDHNDRWWPEAFRLIQDEGRGLMIQGTRDWHDYRVTSTLTPHMAAAWGIGARVQGMRRFYGLLLGPGNQARLVKALDGDTVLGATDFRWELGQPYELALEVAGTRLRAWVQGQLLFDVVDDERPLTGGGVALICEEGRVGAETVAVRPVAAS